MISSILIEGLIYGIMVLGLFTTFRVLNFCDMTVDGSFPLGACVFASCLINGLPSGVALIIAFGAGLIAGLITTLIFTKLHIPDLLAGILTMTMLYSINLRIMSNKANVSYLKFPNLFTHLNDWSETVTAPAVDSITNKIENAESLSSFKAWLYGWLSSDILPNMGLILFLLIFL